VSTNNATVAWIDGRKDLDTLSVIFAYNLRMYLGSSFYFMVKDKGEGDRMLKRLMWRIGLSIFLLLLLYVMFRLGWIQPSGGPVNYG